MLLAPTICPWVSEDGSSYVRCLTELFFAMSVCCCTEYKRQILHRRRDLSCLAVLSCTFKKFGVLAWLFIERNTGVSCYWFFSRVFRTSTKLLYIFFKFRNLNVRLRPFRIQLDSQIVAKQEPISLRQFFRNLSPGGTLERLLFLTLNFNMAESDNNFKNIHGVAPSRPKKPSLNRVRT